MSSFNIKDAARISKFQDEEEEEENNNDKDKHGHRGSKAE